MNIFDLLGSPWSGDIRPGFLFYGGPSTVTYSVDSKKYNWPWMWSSAQQNKGIQTTEGAEEPCSDLVGNHQIEWDCVCSCISVCICVRLPVAMPSPPLTPEKELKGAGVTLHDLWQNPSQIRKLHSSIIAGCEAERITQECVINAWVRVGPLTNHLLTRRLLCRRVVFHQFPERRSSCKGLMVLLESESAYQVSRLARASKFTSVPLAPRGSLSWESKIETLVSKPNKISALCP